MPKSMKRSFKKKNVSKASWLTKYVPRPLAINRQAPGLGRSLKTRLETTFFYQTTTPGATGIFSGYLNPGSCFDPCGDISSIQPVGFDQLKAMYARYLVTGGTVEIEFASSTAFPLPWVFAAYPSTVSTPLGSYQAVASQPYSKEFLIAAGESKKVVFKFDTQKIIGSRLPVIAEDCGALVTADPTTGQNVVLPFFAQYSQAAAAQCTMRVRIIQNVIFDQRIQVVDV